jgi:hypothetical protein
MLLQLHNGSFGACKEVPKGYALMEETDWYRLYLSPVVDKVPATKTHLAFPGLLWGTPVVDLLGTTTQEAAKALIDEKVAAQQKRWAVWKTPHHTPQPSGRAKKGDAPTRKRVKKVNNTGESSESEAENDSNVKDVCETESEGADKMCAEDDLDVSESDVCETDEEYVSDNAFDSDDNDDQYEEDPPEPPLHMDEEEAGDSDDDD